MKLLPYVLLFVLSALGAWFYFALSSQFSFNSQESVIENTAHKALFNSLSEVKKQLKNSAIESSGTNLVRNKIENQISTTTEKEETILLNETDVKAPSSFNETTQVKPTEFDVNTANLEEGSVNSLSANNKSAVSQEKIDELVTAMSREGHNEAWQSHVENALDQAIVQLPMLQNLQGSRVDCRETVCSVNISMSQEEIHYVKTLGWGKRTEILESDATVHFPEGSDEIIVYLSKTTP